MNEKKSKLLIVDDEKEICELTAAHFKRKGYVAFVANSGEEALSLIKEQNPQLMLLDMNLPRMNGIDLLKLVREFNTTLKVIVVSGYAVYWQNQPDVKELNILAFIQKPVALADLESAVMKAVG